MGNGEAKAPASGQPQSLFPVPDSLRSLFTGKPIRRALRRCGVYFERRAREAGFHRIAGVDEVGRGALFGPVLAAAVVLDPGVRIRGIQDSKVLPPEERERLAALIRHRALAVSVASVDAAEIDRINIYQASRLAMRMAVLRIAPSPDLVLSDAIHLDLACPQLPIIHGDALSVSIAAASIIAKVERDRIMREWDRVYPGYGLASSKGYATPEHRARLKELGPTPQHRRSFAPVCTASGDVPEAARLFPEPATDRSSQR